MGVCAGCQNLNWPMRTVCNTKSCQLPREQAEVVPVVQGGKGAGKAGSWTCSSCGNLNWPLRTICNKCGLPKEVASITPAAMDATGIASGGGGSHPEGSWTCASCNNVNWPKRTTCNNKACGPPKEVANITPVAADATGFGGG